MLSRYWLRGRRRGARRADEAVGQYVDRYRTGEWLLVGLILGLSGSDLLLTWLHLVEGGGEANPIMDWFLQAGGVPLFAVAKLSLTLLPLLFLLLHVRFRRVRPALVALLATYGLVLAWHGVVTVDRLQV